MIPRHIDNGAAPRPHECYCCPGSDDGASDVHRKNLVQLLSGSQMGGVTGEKVGSGVVDPNVDAAERLLQPADQSSDLLVLADVRLVHLTSAAKLLDVG